jgi:hypothetical protein
MQFEEEYGGYMVVQLLLDSLYYFQKMIPTPYKQLAMLLKTLRKVFEAHRFRGAVSGLIQLYQYMVPYYIEAGMNSSVY